MRGIVATVITTSRDFYNSCLRGLITALGFAATIGRVPVVKYTRWAAAIQGVFVLICWVGLLYYVPPPSVAIGVLAVAAVIMAVRAEHFTTTEKVVWILIAFGLFFVESRSIYKDRAQHDKEQAEARKEEAQHFQGIADNLKQAIQQSQMHFDATMDKMNGLWSQTTGGETYALVIPALVPIGEPNGFPLIIMPVGDSELTNLSYLVIEGTAAPVSTADILAGRALNFTPLPSLAPHIANPLNYAIHPSKTSVSTYTISLTARNGATSETLQVRFNAVRNEWEYRFKVYRFGPHGESKKLTEQPWTSPRFKFAVSR
jgi:hypothetical protein